MQIPRRDISFDLDPAKVPRDWYRDDGFMTTFLNALSLLFPEGERFFVESVKQQKEHITDPDLQRAVTGFIGQEAMHGREHRAFNELMLAHGYAQAPHVEAGLKVFLKRVRKVLSPMSQLAATTALEHFTAMLAERLLSDPEMRDDFHGEVARMWQWHALEESEHKAVAFDVYRAAGGGYWRRVLIMALATVVFFAAHMYVHGHLMRTRGILWKPWTWARGFTRMWIYPGFFTKLAPAYFSYFRPSFHPDDRDTRTLIATWQKTLFPNEVSA